MNRGIILALSAYIFWGIHPLYWKQLHHVPSVEILAHRIFWSCVFFIILTSIHRNWNGLISRIKSSPNKWIIFLPAFLIGSNWGVYIWAVNAGFIIETSLGYFICPLISVFLGLFFLHERLKPFQWIAVVLAGLGVLAMTFIYGQFPWISLYLAVTWALYGLLRKKSPLSSVEGLTLETLLMALPSLIFITYLFVSGKSSFVVNPSTSFLLMGAGLISGLPLMIFVIGAKLVKLSVIGILQYVYPTLIFLIGYFVYHEPLSQAKLVGFAFIWTALVIYSVEAFLVTKRVSNNEN